MPSNQYCPIQSSHFGTIQQAHSSCQYMQCMTYIETVQVHAAILLKLW